MKTENYNNSRHSRVRRVVGWGIFGLLAATFFALLFAVLVMVLWNWLMPQIFGLVTITFWQAFGLVLLSRLLVGGWHRDHHDRHDGLFHVERMDRDRRKAYRKYWEEEGREAFEKYLQRTRTPGTGTNQPE